MQLKKLMQLKNSQGVREVQEKTGRKESEFLIVTKLTLRFSNGT